MLLIGPTIVFLFERRFPQRGMSRAILGSVLLTNLALAAWVLGTERADAFTDPATDALAACWAPSTRPSETVRALLRVLGAADLADDDALTAAVAARLPALRAGRVEI
jgi:fructuronate reductase